MVTANLSFETTGRAAASSGSSVSVPWFATVWYSWRHISW